MTDLHVGTPAVPATPLAQALAGLQAEAAYWDRERARCAPHGGRRDVLVDEWAEFCATRYERVADILKHLEKA